MLTSQNNVLTVDGKVMYYDRVTKKVKIKSTDNEPDINASNADRNDYFTELYGNTIESEIKDLIEIHVIRSKSKTTVSDEVIYVEEFSYKYNFDDCIEYFNRKFHNFVIANSIKAENQDVKQAADVGEAKIISLKFLVNYLNNIQNEN